MSQGIVQFLRKRDYLLVKELGQGACGKTVLLYDDLLNEEFVCKKYLPIAEALRSELYAGFVREIKLLHRVLHPNVVRIFNYYLYPDQLTGYILMEYVAGADVEEHLRRFPEQASEIFEQVIEGFRYLESNKILHRDIRPGNILVGQDGGVKIIDLGFGKQVNRAEDFDKSITLNWWCELPFEFSTGVYDFKTEIYFVGKLFEKIIQDHGIDHFKYTAALSKMCERNSQTRIASFSDVQKAIQSDLFLEIEFSEDELFDYRKFADALTQAVSKLGDGAKYVEEIDRIKTQLEAAYRGCMLEESIPDCRAVLKSFINGPYYYRPSGFPVSALRNFIRMLKSSSHEKLRIVLANLHTRLDAIDRYSVDEQNDIPF